MDEERSPFKSILNFRDVGEVVNKSLGLKYGS